MRNCRFLKRVFFVFSAVALVACEGAGIEGSWVEPIPGMPGQEQGFTLEAGGKASSINMATLQYESWKQEGDLLILSGKSLGNGQTISFADTLEVKKLDADSLILQQGQMVRGFARLR